MGDVRKQTVRLLDYCESIGPQAWEVVARECLAYMSDADVADMARVADFLPDDDEDTDDDDEPSDDIDAGDDSAILGSERTVNDGAMDPRD